MQEVIINKVNNDISVYILEDGRIAEMYCQKDDSGSTMGNIYNGRVIDIVDGMQAAFVDIGAERNAFISVKDAMDKIDVTKEKLDMDIKMSNILKIGQKLLVQVKKEQIEGKGARISTHVTLPGKYIVLMPKTDIITASQKIENEEERERLRQIVVGVLPSGFGAIIRTDAVGIDKELIISDIGKVLDEWDRVLEKSSNNDENEIVYNDHDIVMRTVRDVINRNTKKIFINDFAIYKKVCEELKDNRCVMDDSPDLISKFGLEGEVLKAQNRKIYLKCGGHIVIDKTEALTAIDVNSGKYTGSKDLEDTILRVNLEAAEEIMKQIRLKDIGGIIVIDFIDMHKDENKKKILEVMHKCARKDRSRVDIREFTQLNLVELTRKKMYV